MKPLNNFDFDYDRFPDALRALADGMDDGSVGLTHIESGSRSPGDGAVEFRLEFEYLTESDDALVTNPAKYDKSTNTETR